MFFLITGVLITAITTLACLKISAWSHDETLREYLAKCYVWDREDKITLKYEKPEPPVRTQAQTIVVDPGPVIWNSYGEPFFKTDANVYRGFRSGDEYNSATFMGYPLERVGMLIQLDQSDQSAKEAYAAGVPLEDIVA